MLYETATAVAVLAVAAAGAAAGLTVWSRRVRLPSLAEMHSARLQQQRRQETAQRNHVALQRLVDEMERGHD